MWSKLGKHNYEKWWESILYDKTLQKKKFKYYFELSSTFKNAKFTSNDINDVIKNVFYPFLPDKVVELWLPQMVSYSDQKCEKLFKVVGCNNCGCFIIISNQNIGIVDGIPTKFCYVEIDPKKDHFIKPIDTTFFEDEYEIACDMVEAGIDIYKI
tara:strand:+ start:1335 stop:1799 length:465 start_codon:yes stop_codon:yes gene_type:complete